MNLYYGIYNISSLSCDSEIWETIDEIINYFFYINTDKLMTMIMKIAVWIIPIIKIIEKDEIKQIKINIRS